MRQRIDVGKVQAAHVQFSLGTLPWWWRVKLAWSCTLHLLVEVTPQDKIRVTRIKVTQRKWVSDTEPAPSNGGPVAVS